MGLYLRKYVKVGPFRFNLSKSGVGLSAGVRGLRLGTGPRGNYVHMGRHGIYYRATIPGRGGATPRPSDLTPSGEATGYPSHADSSHDPLQEIESADVSQIVDSSSQELLSELNSKRRRRRLWPFAAAVGGLLILWISGAGWPGWAVSIVLIVVAMGTYLLYQRDLLNKTTVLFYEFEPELEEAYARLHDAGVQLASCARAWHIEAEGAVRDRKYHAGASSVVRRKPTTIRKTEPPYVKTNVETVAIGVGRQTLHFFPDRVLVYDWNGVGAVGYGQLHLTVSHKRFIEEEGVPSDAFVVDRTWRYVNKKGGPDRRFKDNVELPICLYDEIALASSTGLNEIIQVSRKGVAEGFAAAISVLSSRVDS